MDRQTDKVCYLIKSDKNERYDIYRKSQKPYNNHIIILCRMQPNIDMANHHK